MIEQSTSYFAFGVSEVANPSKPSEAFMEMLERVIGAMGFAIALA
jgi:hypothetical protein